MPCHCHCFSLLPIFETPTVYYDSKQTAKAACNPLRALIQSVHEHVMHVLGLLALGICAKTWDTHSAHRASVTTRRCAARTFRITEGSCRRFSRLVPDKMFAANVGRERFARNANSPPPPQPQAQPQTQPQTQPQIRNAVWGSRSWRTGLGPVHVPREVWRPRKSGFS